ncbi:TPA: HNH endonuclease [Salmonella enterica subsp. enterica serovar Aberdeen]
MRHFNPTPPPDSLRDYIYYDDGHIYRAETGKRLGHLNQNRYFLFTYLGRTYLVHRLIYWLHTGEWPPVVDHKDRNKQNNRIENLKPANQVENSRNNSIRHDNKTGYTGVKFYRGKFSADITLQGKRFYSLGYETPEAAALARDILINWFYGDFARYGILDKASIKVGGKAI